jgi:hypothetical protein
MRRAETNVRLSGMQVSANTIVYPKIPIARQPRAFVKGPTRPIRQSEPLAIRPVLALEPRAKAGTANSSARPKKMSHAAMSMAYSSEGHLKSKIRAYPGKRGVVDVPGDCQFNEVNRGRERRRGQHPFECDLSERFGPHGRARMDGEHQSHHDRSHHKDQDFCDRQVRIRQGLPEIADEANPTTKTTT